MTFQVIRKAMSEFFWGWFRWTAQVRALCLCALLALSAPAAHAQFDAGTVGALLVAAGPIVDDAIEKAGNEGDYLTFRVASELKLLIEGMRLAGNDLLNRTFDELDDSQQQVFQNLRVTLEGLQDGIAMQVSEIREGIDQIHQISNDWQFAGPTVLRSSPAIQAPTNSESVFVIFRGLSLDNANPRLIVGGQDLERVKLEKNEVTFLLPTSLLSFDRTNVSLNRGELVLSTQSCAFLKWGCNNDEVTFEYALMTLPEVVARVTVVATTVSEERVYEGKERYKQFGYSTGDQTKRKCRTFNQGPHAPGWFIDTDSVVSRSRLVSCPFPNTGLLAALAKAHCPNGKYNEPAQFGRNGSATIRSKSPTGFSVEACAKGYIKGFSTKAGERRINIFWKEYKLEQQRSSQAPVSQEIAWGKSTDWQFPLDSEAVRIEIESFDGTTYVASGNDGGKFFEIDYNAGTKQLIVRAKLPTDIADLN